MLRLWSSSLSTQSTEKFWWKYTACKHRVWGHAPHKILRFRDHICSSHINQGTNYLCLLSDEYYGSQTYIIRADSLAQRVCNSSCPNSLVIWWSRKEDCQILTSANIKPRSPDWLATQLLSILQLGTVLPHRMAIVILLGFLSLSLSEHNLHSVSAWSLYLSMMFWHELYFEHNVAAFCSHYAPSIAQCI